MARNADHNVRTRDGGDSFHGMGMNAIVTPGTKNTKQILRVKASPKDRAAVGGVPVLPQGRKSRYDCCDH